MKTSTGGLPGNERWEKEQCQVSCPFRIDTWHCHNKRCNARLERQVVVASRLLCGSSRSGLCCRSRTECTAGDHIL